MRAEEPGEGTRRTSEKKRYVRCPEACSPIEIVGLEPLGGDVRFRTVSALRLPPEVPFVYTIAQLAVETPFLLAITTASQHRVVKVYSHEVPMSRAAGLIEGRPVLASPAIKPIAVVGHAPHGTGSVAGVITKARPRCYASGSSLSDAAFGLCIVTIYKLLSDIGEVHLIPEKLACFSNHFDKR